MAAAISRSRPSNIPRRCGFPTIIARCSAMSRGSRSRCSMLMIPTSRPRSCGIRISGPSRPTTPICASSNARSPSSIRAARRNWKIFPKSAILALTMKSDAPRSSRCPPIPTSRKPASGGARRRIRSSRPAEGRGSGGIRYRYWDPDRGDDAWAYLNTDRARAARQRDDPEFVAGADHLGRRSCRRLCGQAAGVQLQVPRRAQHARHRAREKLSGGSVSDRRTEHHLQRGLGDAAYLRRSR